MNALPEPIHQLTSGVAAGDAAAVEAFYRRYFDFLLATARRATGRDESFCLDVVQESVLRILRSIRAIDEEKRLLAWLRIVVRSCAYDLLRVERRRMARELELVEQRGCDDFPYGLWDESQITWLATQIEALDGQLKKLIELRYEQRWSLRRIAESLGLKTGAIDGRLRRAIAKLQTAAAERFEHD